MERKLSLALIDDHEMVLQGLKALLSSNAGFEVKQCWTNGFEAVEHAKGDVDIYLVDMNMPEINGLETAELLLRKVENAKVIFLSMELKKAYMDRAKDIGAMGYISKSASIDELMNSIKKVANGQECFTN